MSMATYRPRGAGGACRKGVVAAAWAAALALGAAAPAGAQERTTLSLDDAVRTALRQNRDVRAGRYALEQANKRVKEAWSAVYPSLDWNASYTRNVSPSVMFFPKRFIDPDAGQDEYMAVQFGADNQWNSTVSLEQPLFSAAAFIGVGAAGRFKGLQEEVVRGLTQGVVTRVRATYYQLLLQQEQLRLITRSVERGRQSLAETRALNAAGLASDYDVLRLEVALANLEPNLKRAGNAVGQAQRQLAIELDLPADQPVEVRGSLATMHLDALAANEDANREVLAFSGFRGEGMEAVDEAIRMAQELRSDIRQLTLTESLRKTEMRLEQVQLLPRISFFGNYVISAQDNNDPNFFAKGDGQRAYARNIGVRVSMPIFGGGRVGRIEQKRAALRQAETQTQLVEDQARMQVRNLVEQTDEALLRARGQRLAVQQAQRGYEIASAQYREGLGSQLELTDAEVALRESEFNYAQAVFDFLIARAQLDQATGQVPIVDVEPVANNGYQD
ncbi:MAG: TolC family protein [Gemmatimonadetes bacterium]|nr:TolC family protein [Gemmatimonadota bacterium]